jgi:ABC-type multidrug transport system ATPase subunit
VASVADRSSDATQRNNVDRVLDVVDVTCRFGSTVALDDVNLSLRAGEIHALLGPNGAGKTTLLRVLAGLITPTAGSIRVAPSLLEEGPKPRRRPIGLLPSGDRTFYLRLSGLENLVFFARLYGMSRREALARSRTLLERVDLADSARTRTGVYSSGMLKRLSVARALLPGAPLLLIDEATHDLDPDGARRVRDLIREAAADGSAVLWTTQRLEEIRGFADRVTVLSKGHVRFEGSVPKLLARVSARRYVLQLSDGRRSRERAVAAMKRAVRGVATVEPAADGEDDHVMLSLGADAVLGDALAALTEARFRVVSCNEAESGIEEAFLAVTGEASP